MPPTDATLELPATSREAVSLRRSDPLAWLLIHGGVLLTVFFLTLAIRWALVDRSCGPHFNPRPDSIEYAAAAQALAQEGRCVLHVGPHTVPPRYAPGWPMILAVFLRIRLHGEGLWRVSGLFGAANAVLLSLATMLLVHVLRPRSELAPNDVWRAGFWTALAGLVAGCGWAITPASVDWDRQVMSDEAGAFLANAALLLLAIGGLSPVKSSWPNLAMLAGGVCAGMTAAVRPVAGCLLLVPSALLIAGAVALRGSAAVKSRLAVGAFGLILIIGLTMAIQVRSGRNAWQWSGYSFWIPEMYEQLDRAFNTNFALNGNPDFPVINTRTHRAMSHLEIAERFFLGSRGLTHSGNMSLGRGWPLAGWLFAILLVVGGWRQWRGDSRRRLALLAVAMALVTWIAGHIAVYSMYFFPSVRFYLAPAAWCWVLLAATFGLGWQHRRRWLGGLAMFGMVCVTLAAIKSVRPLIALHGLGPDGDNGIVRRNFEDWIAMTDQERSEMETPFDPVHAQAIGLLTPDVLAKVHEWGSLPETEQVWRLRGNKVIP